VNFIASLRTVLLVATALAVIDFIYSFFCSLIKYCFQVMSAVRLCLHFISFQAIYLHPLQNYHI